MRSHNFLYSCFFHALLRPFLPKELLIFRLNVVRMKAEEELVEVEPQALILMRVDIHVVMIRVVLISIVMNSFDEKIVNKIRAL